MVLISVLQLAFVRVVRRGGAAAGGRHVPPFGALVQEVRAALGDPDVRATHLHPVDGDGPALGDLDLEDRLLTRLLLLLLELRSGLLAELVARGLPVAALERGVEALGDRGGVVGPRAGAATGDRQHQYTCQCDDPGFHHRPHAPVRGRAKPGSFAAMLRSLWFEDTQAPVRPPLERDIAVDAVVVGAGIVGLTTALLLEREGLEVAVLEMRHVAAGATGYNTAKVTSLHGLTYSGLKQKLGAEHARAYGEANEAGIARVFELAGELGIDCDLARKPNYTYTEDAAEVDSVREEAEVASELGLPAAYVEDTDLPFGVAGAVRFDDQAEFHPVKYVDGIAAALRGPLHENTRVTGIDSGRVNTASGARVSAGQIVVATHLSFLDRGLYFARCHPERSYVVAGRTTDAPGGMYLSTESPARSIRSCAGRRRTRCRWTACPTWAATTRSPRTSGWRPASRSGGSPWAPPRPSCSSRRSPGTSIAGRSCSTRIASVRAPPRPASPRRTRTSRTTSSPTACRSGAPRAAPTWAACSTGTPPRRPGTAPVTARASRRRAT